MFYYIYEQKCTTLTSPGGGGGSQFELRAEALILQPAAVGGEGGGGHIARGRLRQPVRAEAPKQQSAAAGGDGGGDRIARVRWRQPVFDLGPPTMPQVGHPIFSTRPTMFEWGLGWNSHYSETGL